MRFLYIVTRGMDDPTLASVPLHLAANGSVELGREVSVVLSGHATELAIIQKKRSNYLLDPACSPNS